MGGGKSKSKSTSSSVSGSAQKWAQPYAIGGASSVQSVFNQNQPGLQNLTKTVQDDLVPSLLSKYKSGLGNVGAANAFSSDVLSGKYLNGNPYLDDVIGRASGDVTSSVAGLFSGAGRYGSAAHQGVLADKIGELSSGLRYQNYATEMDRMGQAAQNAQNFNTADISQALAAIGAGAELPYVGSSNLANSLGALFSGGSSQSKSTQTQGGGFLGNLLSAGAQIGSAAIMASSRHLKTKIKLLRRDPDGLGWYEFAYKRAPDTMLTGVMADEVKALRPAAYIADFNGHEAVNYAAL